MRNILLRLSYDGTNYHGFQRQQYCATVQQTVEEALSVITKATVSLTGCSRTDAGVHAADYVCNFYSDTRMPAEKFPLALNALLPDDISCLHGEDVSEDFHARFCAKSKTYSYTIHNAPHRHALISRFAWHYPLPLDITAMQTAARFLIGRHDFRAFVASGGQHKNTVKEIDSLTVEQSGDIIKIRIHASGYLYNMVRIIAGTLVYTGCGKLAPKDMEPILLSRDRTLAGMTAPPQGLCLDKVFY